MPDTMHTCDKCGDEYESYPVFITDNFNAIVEWRQRKEEYKHLCPDCNDEYWEGEAPGFNKD